MSHLKKGLHHSKVILINPVTNLPARINYDVLADRSKSRTSKNSELSCLNLMR